jgi:hypothetical protein
MEFINLLQRNKKKYFKIFENERRFQKHQQAADAAYTCLMHNPGTAYRYRITKENIYHKFSG